MVLPSQTCPLPCADPKPDPETVTTVPADPPWGDTDVIVGEGSVGGVCTVTEALADTVPIVAVSVAVPAAAPNADPGGVDVVRVGALDDVHAATEVRSMTVPSERVPLAANCCEPPMYTVAGDGEIARLTRVAEVSDEEPFTEPAVAVIDAAPGVRASAVPAFPVALLTSATAGADRAVAIEPVLEKVSLAGL